MKKSEIDVSRSPDWGSYVLDNAAPQTPARFSALAELYDATTIRHLQRIGVEYGWQCWEIGAGPGSIAQWLCGQVGPSGSVLATDIDTRFLDRGGQPNLTICRHDIVLDPLPDNTFDVVHARLVLVHLPEREQALDRMITALKPGGWLLAEEFDSVSQLPAPDRYPWEVALKSTAALRTVMIDRGVNLGFGRTLAGHLRARGMDVTFVISTDTHHTREFARMELGVLQATRGWVEPSRIANLWPREKFLGWLRARPS